MKNTAADGTDSPEHALIFIPDISGFTQFVSETEISHSRHIINELLNIILDANQLSMEVSEVEGDAVLFYRFGKAPAAEELLAQVKKMFTDFHLHLKKYESHRICNCGACKVAHGLAIKFVAHYGEIAINQVQQFKKLFGKDVIVAHRLLKNDIEKHEYALFTDNLTERSSHWQPSELEGWGSLHKAMQEYDSGKVSYSYMYMDALYDLLPPLTEDDYKIHGFTSAILKTEVEVKAPIDLVFDVMSDIRYRGQWIPGLLPEMENMNTEIPQTGQTHKCLANGPVIVSHEYDISTDMISFSETDINKTQCTVYTLKKLTAESTKVTITCFMPRNPIKELVFKFFLKKKFVALFNKAGSDFKKYCENLVENQRSHPFKVEIKAG